MGWEPLLPDRKVPHAQYLASSLVLQFLLVAPSKIAKIEIDVYKKIGGKFRVAAANNAKNSALRPALPVRRIG
jgi:hypothetical protein